MIPWAAKWTACWLEPHWRSMVVAGTDSGKPAPSTAFRAMFMLCSSTWRTHPAITSSTSSESIPVLSTSAERVCERRSVGCQSLRALPRLPTGVRTASTITGSFISTICLSFHSESGSSWGVGRRFARFGSRGSYLSLPYSPLPTPAPLARLGIPIPVPDPADTAAGLEHDHLKAQPAHGVQGPQTRETRPDNDHVCVFGCHPCPSATSPSRTPGSQACRQAAVHRDHGAGHVSRRP